MQDLVNKNPAVLPYRYELANFQAALAGMDLGLDEFPSPENDARSPTITRRFLRPPQIPEVWLRLGVMQRQMGQFDTALASFEQAGNADPKSVAAFLNQALICDALGKKKKSIDSYNKVLAVDPDNALALNNLAFMTADSGANLDQAMTWAERAKKRCA